MNLNDLINDISHYLRVRGTEQEYMMLSFINDSIIDFIKMDEWEGCKSSYDLTTDGTGYYDLDFLFSSFSLDPFYGEIALYSEGLTLEKKSYEYYIQQTSKTGLWSMLGNVLYVDGEDTEYTLVYKTPGYPFPLAKANGAIESKVLKAYWDIISKMSSMKFLAYLGDDASLGKESSLLDRKLMLARQHENRIRKNGQFAHVARWTSAI